MSGSTARSPDVTIREFSFDDPALPAIWESLLAVSDVRMISQTLAWQSAWWGTLGRGRLLLLGAGRGPEPEAIASLFCDEGMVFFVGVGEADWHDVLGAGHDPELLGPLLGAAIERTPDFVGMKLHFIPERSRTAAALAVVAGRLGLDVYEMDSIVSVEVDIAADPGSVRQAVSRSMRKAENFFRKNGDLVIHQLTTAAEVLPLLPEFFARHVARWRLKHIDSYYLRPEVRAFLTRWIEVSAAAGWLRVVRLEWRGETLGIDLNWHFGTTQHSGQWVFDTRFMDRSPGQILLRHSVLMALEAGMRTYDLGLGDQAYKFRLPARTVRCTTWGLYPPD
ncbi:MAG: GNAT family N-acetyltransferase [Planctomycetia bacterium]